MRMDVVREDVKKLIEKELKAANDKFPQFHSMHEAYGVMLEEQKELEVEMNEIQQEMIDLFNEAVMHDQYRCFRISCEYIKKYSINAAVEAIQLATMAQKSLDFLENFRKDEEVIIPNEDLMPVMEIMSGCEPK